MRDKEKLEKLMNTNWPDDTGKEVTIKHKKEDNCGNEIKPLSRLRIIRDMQLPSGANVSVLINAENLSEQYSLYLLSVSTYFSEDIRTYDKENDIYESERSGRTVYATYYSIGDVNIELIVNTRKVSDKHSQQFISLGNKYAKKIKNAIKEAASKNDTASEN